jgi:CheY-like chemotaxis protein
MDVLLVEDNREVSLITVEYLTELGHCAVAVTDAEAAVVQLAERSFDAVLTDVSLPGMSGIELAKELVKKYPDLPVVISSGYDAGNVESMLGRREPNVYVLPKPFDMPTLQGTLNEAQAFVESRAKSGKSSDDRMLRARR